MTAKSHCIFRTVGRPLGALGQFSIDLIMKICSPQIHVATDCANQPAWPPALSLASIGSRGQVLGVRGHKHAGVLGLIVLNAARPSQAGLSARRRPSAGHRRKSTWSPRRCLLPQGAASRARAAGRAPATFKAREPSWLLQTVVLEGG